MTAYHESRKVLAIGGDEARDFLQDLVTNNVGGLDAGLVYAALLTPQGKYLADFFLQLDSDRVLLDVDAMLAEGLLKRLTMYRLRRPVSLEMTDLAVSRGQGVAPDGALPDPRDAALGWRLIADAPVAEDNTDWDALHVARGIPQSGEELHPDVYILEMGFERLAGVDFRKGCYVGQEIVARMKHKTELRKGLARVRIEGDAAPGDALLAGGKPAGQLHTRAGDEALAYVRFDRAEGGMTAGEAQVTLIGPAIDPFDIQ
ncbi:CAF17-like 4Fe-4S cluster assembly/insertion protein YgfZ [Roseobacteraceae bacterium S113]